ncbi:hypothetical protein GCK72_002987 [Caenorhabditis remanei]|uniref:glucuronosyltransferase n=1 Tax=Caenorhabditis remanei TaxID=31234 RepID=A0A6A5HVH0_CAERE|nr:hypothetical protein GCK72_002987 [Caenorhabditis remanei]KAF1771161.1 hypothetical protein GCK72_002987 [Caenorhabditis remanei]
MEDAERMKKALEDILYNENYKKNALKLADILTNQPYSPKENVIKYTEFVGEHGPFPDTNPYGRRLNYFQKTFLDIYATFALFYITVAVASVIILRKIYSKVRKYLSWKSTKKTE